MRRHLLSAFSASATLVLLTACGGGSTTQAPASQGSAACTNAKAAHKAYVVVQHASGATVQRCVGFDGQEASAEDLMKQSKIPFQTQKTSFGKAVCQIDNEPAQFAECFPKNQPFWALFVSKGSGSWTVSQVGFGQVNLGDGDALGWAYRPQTQTDPSPPPAPRKP